MPATGTLTNTGETRAGIDFPRRDIFIWVCSIILLNQLFDVVRETPSASPEQLLTDLGAVGIFQIMAWYAVFRLLASSDPAPVAQLRDFLITVALCCLVFVPSTRMIWVAVLGVAIFGWLFNGGPQSCAPPESSLPRSQSRRSGGAFSLNSSPFLCAETAVVGTVLQAVRAGTEWRDNVITGPSGHGIVVYDLCSSFHNLSVAVLCWVTMRSLQDRSWQVRDFVTGCVLGTTMVLFNMM